MPHPRRHTDPHADLARACMPLLVLSILADGPRHGQGIQKRLQAAAGTDLPAGSLYPLLKQLEDAGHIRRDQEPTGRKRTWCHLTPQGHEHFKHEAAHWIASLAKLQGLVLPALRQAKHHPRKAAFPIDEG